MFATIYLPNFYLQAATRHQPELCTTPVAMIEEQDKKPVVVQLNDDRFLVLFFDHFYRRCGKFWLMPGGGLQIEIRQIYRGEHQLIDHGLLPTDLDMRSFHNNSQLRNRILL